MNLSLSRQTSSVDYRVLRRKNWTLAYAWLFGASGSKCTRMYQNYGQCGLWLTVVADVAPGSTGGGALSDQSTLCPQRRAGVIYATGSFWAPFVRAGLLLWCVHVEVRPPEPQSATPTRCSRYSGSPVPAATLLP